MTLTSWLALWCVASVVFGALWGTAFGPADLTDDDGDDWGGA